MNQEYIRGQRAQMNMYDDFDDFFTQQQIDEICPPFPYDEDLANESIEIISSFEE